MEEPASDKRVWGLSKSKYWKFVLGFLALILSAIFLYNIVFGAVGSSFLHNLFSAVSGPEAKFKLVGQISIAPNSGSVEEFVSEGEADINSKIRFQRATTQSQLVEKKADRLTPKDGAIATSGHKIIQPTINTASTTQVVEKAQAATSSEAEQTILSRETPAVEIFKQCGFAASSEPPTHPKLVINEVAWMGSATSTSDEWIELKNILSVEIDLSGWQLIDKDEQIKINLSGLVNPKIVPGGFILLERTDDDSVPNIVADLIYVGALSNSDEGLRLFDSQCVLADEVKASPDWPAGDNASAAERKTMERSANTSGWYTSSVFGGTPKKENSSPSVTTTGGGGDGGATSGNNQQSPAKILISEIQTYPTGNRFIELYNPNSSAVNLTNWYIQRKTQSGTSFTSLVSKTYFDNKVISAYGYFLISRDSLSGSDIISDNLTLTESNTIQIKNPDGEVIDKIGWGQAGDCEGSCAAEPSSSQGIQRKFQNNTFIDTENNAQDFKIQTCPSPKAQSKTCQQANQAPSAFFVYTPSNPQVGDLIAFDAISSSDPDGQIVSYEWDFGNSQAATTQAATTYSYSTAGNYTIQLIVFDNQNASSVAISTTISIISVGVNHLLISEIYPDKTGNNFDFVELHNPTNSSISLGNYSLKILKEGATSTTSLAGFSTSYAIAAKSFFLVGLDNYNHSAGTIADVFHSSYSLPTTKTATIILYNNSNSVDEFNYNPANLAAGQSLERKAFYNNQCVSPQNDGEFLGNGCDTDNESDFEIRNIPNPQNSGSSLES